MRDHTDKRSGKNGIKAHKERRKRRSVQYWVGKRRRHATRNRRLWQVGILVTGLILCVLLARAVWKKVTAGGPEEQASAASLEIESGEKEQAAEEAEAVLHISGDIIMHKPFLTSSAYYDGENYDYHDIFRYVKQYYEKADFAVCTTEYALTGSNYSGYPTFCSPDAIAEALGDSGIDMCLLANNHIYDGGDEGLMRTMEVLDEQGILYTGARQDESDKKYVVQDINGIKVGMFNYVFETEVVNGQKTINGIAVSDESSDLINTFREADPESFYEEAEEILQDMKAEGVEYTVAYMHWGVEYQTQENEDQEAIAQALCDMGVDALIASHPHVIQPVDLLESSDGSHQMVCAYAIGNHLSNQRTEYMDGLVYGYSEDGMMVTLTIHRDADGEIALTGADFIPTWVYMGQSTDREYFILPLADPDTLEEETGLSGLSQDVQESLERTESIVGEGVEKVQDALPIVRR